MLKAEVKHRESGNKNTETLGREEQIEGILNTQKKYWKKVTGNVSWKKIEHKKGGDLCFKNLEVGAWKLRT